MSAVFRIILGSLARHWLTAMLAMVSVRIGLSADDSKAAVASLSNDVVYNGALALGAAVLPGLWSIIVRLRGKLKQRLGLQMPAGTSETEVKAMISEAPLGARIAATLTADPNKL